MAMRCAGRLARALVCVCLSFACTSVAIADTEASPATIRSYVFCQDGELWVADRDGEHVTRIAGGPDFPRAELLHPSPNARRIAWITEDEGELWVLERGGATRHLGAVQGRRVQWSADEQWIALLDDGVLVSPRTGAAVPVGGYHEGPRGISYVLRLVGWASVQELLVGIGSEPWWSPETPPEPTRYSVSLRPLWVSLHGYWPESSRRDRTLWSSTGPPGGEGLVAAAVSPARDTVAVWTAQRLLVVGLQTGGERTITSDLPPPEYLLDWSRYLDWRGCYGGYVRPPALIWSPDGDSLCVVAGGGGNGDAEETVRAWGVEIAGGEAAGLMCPPRRQQSLPPPLRARLRAELSAHAQNWEHFLRGGRIVCPTQRPPQYWLPEPRDRDDAVIHVSSVSAGAEVYVEGAFCAVAPCDVRVSDLPAQGRRVRLALMAARAPIVCQQWFVQRGLDAAGSVALDPDRLLTEGSALSWVRAAIVHEDPEAFLSLVAPEGMMIDLSLADNGEWGRYWSAEELRARLLAPPRPGGAPPDRAPSLRDVLFRTCRELFLRGRFVVDECLPVVGSDSWKAAAPIPAAATPPPDWSPYAEPYEIVLMCRRAPPAITGIAVVGLRQ